MKRAIPVAMAALALASLADPASAQDRPVVQLADTADLVFEREVFAYPSYVRRNPFVPLLSADGNGPRFEELELLGVVHHANPLYSVALFGVGSVTNAGSGGGGGGGGGSLFQTHRLRRGDIIGNTRIVSIGVDRVVVEVEEFGMTERHVLELPRADQGGPS